MNLNFKRNLSIAGAAIFLSARLLAAEVSPADTNDLSAVTRDEMAKNYLQIQEQIHSSQLAIELNQQAAADVARSNANVLTARLKSLEQSVAAQHVSDADAARKTQQLTMFMAGAFGLTGLGVMVLMVYFQWRAFTQLAQISSRQNAAMAGANAVHELAAPGRATVDASNAQLLNVVSRLEQRINELESGQKMLPVLTNGRLPDLLTEGQQYLDANAPLKALECFDQYLSMHPERAEALVKRAAALEKLGRNDEALACYNRAIAADGTVVVAHLHKGGLLNRLRRYDEALNCYEQALQAQDKKAKA